MPPSLFAVTIGVIALCSGIAQATGAASHFGSGTEAAKSFVATDGSTIGYVEHWTKGARSEASSTIDADVTLILMPGLSGTASRFSEWFSVLLESPRVEKTVAIDWRGYGLSLGPWGPDAPPSGPGAPSYAAITTWRLAADLKELLAQLGLPRPGKKLMFLAHSLGLHVLFEHIVLFGTSHVDGVLLLDQSVRNMDFGTPVSDTSFPSGINTFTPEMLRGLLEKMQTFSPGKSISKQVGLPQTTRSELWEAEMPYEKHFQAMLTMFRAADEPDYDGPLMAQTSTGLMSWMNALGASNGKVFARLMASVMFEELTGVNDIIRNARVPFLYYGGTRSIVPDAAISWAAHKMSHCAAATSSPSPGTTSSFAFGSLRSFCGAHESPNWLLIFNGTAGNHCPWLNEDGSQDQFFDILKDFVAKATQVQSKDVKEEL